MFCVDLRTSSDYFSIQQQLIGFYNRSRECLLRGTKWVFKSDRYSFVLKGLISCFNSPHLKKMLELFSLMSHTHTYTHKHTNTHAPARTSHLTNTLFVARQTFITEASLQEVTINNCLIKERIIVFLFVPFHISKLCNSVIPFLFTPCRLLLWTDQVMV